MQSKPGGKIRTCPGLEVQTSNKSVLVGGVFSPVLDVSR